MKPPPGIEEFKDIWLVEGDTHIGAWVKEHGSLNIDPHLFRWLRPHFTTKGIEVVWDIGANIGDHTQFYLSLGAEVVAIEPNPLAFACLVHNCPDAICHNIAASDVAGSLNFAVSDNVGASRVTADGEWSVPAMALDDMPALPAPGFVKIDVEGYELNALIGMENTLRTHMPVIFCEINAGALAANGSTPADIRTFLEFTGYSRFTLYPPTATWGDAQFDILVKP